MALDNLTGEQIQVFFLIFVRTTAMLALLPIFGSQNVPARVRAGLSFLLAIVLFNQVPVPWGQMPDFSLPVFVVSVVREVFVGIVIGFATVFLFAAVQFAGRLCDTQMGFAMVQLVDPFSDASVTVSGQLQILLFSIIFLVTNAHYFMLLAIQKSFQVIPLLGGEWPSGEVAGYFVDMVGSIFVLAVRLAAPVFSVLVLTSLSLGIVARTVPQINIFFVGLPLKIGTGFVTLVVVLPVLAVIFRSMVDKLVRDMWTLLYLMA